MFCWGEITRNETHKLIFQNWLLGSWKGTITRRRSCQSASVGFCLGRCCEPLCERTPQMRLRYTRTPAWKEKRNNCLQLLPRPGNISAPKHCNLTEGGETCGNLELLQGARGHLPSLWSPVQVWGFPFPSSISLCHSPLRKLVPLVHSQVNRCPIGWNIWAGAGPRWTAAPSSSACSFSPLLAAGGPAATATAWQLSLFIWRFGIKPPPTHNSKVTQLLFLHLWMHFFPL